MTKSSRNYRKAFEEPEFEELELVAYKFWPFELSRTEAKRNTIPLLLETQDQFISIISIETTDLNKLFDIIEASSLSANLFLKHLVILADYGGEMLQRVSAEFSKLFPTRELHYLWQGQQRSYFFKALPNQKFSNKALKIDGKELLKKYPLTDLQKDAIVLLLFGNTHSNENSEVASALARCKLGECLGEPDLISTIVKQRYFWFSQILQKEGAF